MTRPWRRMIRHLLQIFLTLGLTFTGVCLYSVVSLVRVSLVAVDDPPPGQVVGRELHDDPVLGQDADVVLSHFAADVGQDPVTVGELDPEHRVREWLNDAALDLDGTVLLRHILRYLTLMASDGHFVGFHGGRGPPMPAADPTCPW